MNHHRHAYVFSDKAKATRFYNAVHHSGHEVHQVGNAVLTNDRVYSYVLHLYVIDDDDEPIWMGDHE